MIFYSIFYLIILLTVVLGRDWGLQTHAAPQKPAAPWCWSHPWWKKEQKIRFPILSLSKPFLFFSKNKKSIQRRCKITVNTMWTQQTGWGKAYFLHESISQPEFLFLSIPVMFVPLFIPAAERGVWKQFKQLADAECFSTPKGGKRCVGLMKNS